MSEPVGNAPRNPGDIPGNSHKDRVVRPEKITVSVDEKAEPKEPVQKIIEGKVVTRKVPWYKKWAKNLVADDAQSIGDFVMQEMILPGVRNLIRDAVVGGVDRTLYGTSKARGRSTLGERPGLRTRYDRMSEDRGEPRRMMSREDRARHDFDAVVLSSREEAIEVVEALIDRVQRYGSASVADMYDLVGVTGSYADRSYGWTDLRSADVRQTRGGYLLDLPRPEPLR